jgi:hypothetical protein
MSHRSSLLAVAAAALVLLAACGGTSNSDAGGSTTTPASSSPIGVGSADTTDQPTVVCGNPDGGFCLGPLQPGTYHTKAFRPRLAYSVPKGWENDEDLAGNFLLVPPSGNLGGVNPGTSDFIGVYTSVDLHANRCPTIPASGVGASTPAAYMAWLRQDPAFRPGPVHAVTIGGLHGLTRTLRIAPDWRMRCQYSGHDAVAPLLVGVPPSGLDHNVLSGQATKLYLLANGPHVLAVEVVDIKDAGTLEASSRVVNSFMFGR